MSAASNAYAALHEAMQMTDPACQDDDRFILDDQPAESLAHICDRCPLLDLCKTYATAARPKGGIWAGKRFRSNQPRKALTK